ncbi:putative glycolipid-binding domain-containing protein [Nocardioides sp.]|uniref:putative glycolipid-binding domain-containing protein n=1 Tax=Nocardioides sp. TaxID=35761 RepID=UPI002ED16DBE
MQLGTLAPLPARAAWRHHSARDATEIVTVRVLTDGCALSGVVAGVEDGRTWALSYEIEVDDTWRTRSAWVGSLAPGDPGEVVLTRTGERWTVDGRHLPELDGLLDVDLEGSAMTNTLPVHRTDLADRTAAAAAYVRLDLTARRLDQWYGPAEPVAGGGWTVRYAAPEFGADFDLTYDAAGLVVEYPGLATRLL